MVFQSLLQLPASKMLQRKKMKELAIRHVLVKMTVFKKGQACVLSPFRVFFPSDFEMLVSCGLIGPVARPLVG
jgi:hypothetical protein